jgi:hypothetical protein
VKIFRWIAAAGVGLAAWCAVCIVGALTYGPVEQLLCPDGDFISGICRNPTVKKFMSGWIVLFVGLSGIVVVAAASWAAAPERKVLAAWLALVAGGVIAAYFAVMTGMYVAGGVAIVLGAATAAAIGKRVKTIGPLGPGGAT